MGNFDGINGFGDREREYAGTARKQVKS